MKRISLHVPEPWLKQLDEVVERGHYPNRSDAIRAAIRDLLREHGLWGEPKT